MQRRLILLGLACALASGGCNRPEAGPGPGPTAPVESAALAVEDEGPGAAAPALRPVFVRDVAPLLAKYCTGCHDAAKARGGVVLDRFPANDPAAPGPELWEKVAVELRADSMPPPGKPRPTPEENDILLAWLDEAVSRGASAPAAGRVTLHRLNRTEYNNTIRDLFGMDLRPADDFPADDVGYGFDNVGDVLSLPPLLLEKYLAATEKVVDAAFGSDVVRQRLLAPPPDDPILLPARAVHYPLRDPGKRLILSAADLPPADAATQERLRAYEVLRAFADRAYRRPVTHDELQRLLRFVEAAQKDGAGGEKGIRLAMRAILVSPHFLFRVELPGPEGGERVNDFELATRLSYFLWSSMPDEELFHHAARKTLRDRATLAAQVRRMLLDPRSRSLAVDFAGQWLQTRALAACTPDPACFPDFDEPLRAAMLRETELFVDAVVREDRSVLEMLDTDWTFVNERLARHYGIPGIAGDEFRRVALAGTPRGGLVTQASILTVTSNPTRTSPVKRGKWILDNLLGAPPPSPPPGAGDLREEKEALRTGTLRERLERHRADSTCASCHRRMDPLGFGLENFDAVGAWRSHDRALPIDAFGTLPGGESFRGPAELRAVLMQRKDAFARCLTEKLLVFALGRGIGPQDRRVVDGIVRKVARNDYRFSALVHAIVQSDLFRNHARGQIPP
jgi:hypothetical protein